MRKWVLVGLCAVVAGAIGSLVYANWFAPEGSTVVQQPPPDLGSGAPAEPLRSGSFSGADSFHFARGNVSLLQAANGTFVLRFEGYDAREGPDVYLYLTRMAGASTAEAVEQGRRIHVPGGAADGRATLRGSFNVYLPPETDALAYQGITIWCDQFNAFFGHAALQ